MILESSSARSRPGLRKLWYLLPCNMEIYQSEMTSLVLEVTLSPFGGARRRPHPWRNNYLSSRMLCWRLHQNHRPVEKQTLTPRLLPYLARQ